MMRGDEGLILCVLWIKKEDGDGDVDDRRKHE